MAYPIRRYLKEILKKGDAPAYECRYVPFAIVEVLEVTIPGNGHENI